MYRLTLDPHIHREHLGWDGIRDHVCRESIADSLGTLTAFRQPLVTTFFAYLAIETYICCKPINQHLVFGIHEADM